MPRLNIERQNELEPIRMEFAHNSLSDLGYLCEVDGKSINFIYKGNKITVFPYSGYFSGKGIVAGRGIKKLLSQLKPNELSTTN